MNLLRPVARFAHRHRWPTSVAFLALIAITLAYGIGATSTLTTGGFEDPGSESAEAARVLEETFGQRSPDVVVMYSSASANYRDPAFRDRVRPVLERLAATPEVEDLASPYGSAGPALVSRDGHAVLVTFALRGDPAQQQETYRRLEPTLRPTGLRTRMGGAVPSNDQAQGAAARDLERGEWIALPIVAVLLVIFFRGVVAAAVPLLVGAFAVGAALSWIRLLAGVTEVSIFAVDIVSFVGLGIAIDYSLFLTSRFREELRAGCTVSSAVERSLGTAGRTIAYSGLIVGISLLGLLAFPIVLLRSVAIAGLLVVAMALVATLVFLPAVLAALGSRIEWLRIGRARPPAGRGHWQRLARFVMRAPISITVLTTALLLLLGAPFLRLEESVGGPGILPPSAEGREVAEALASPRFPAGRASPIPVVVVTDEPVLTQSGLEALERYADDIASLPGVTHVDAVVGGGSPRTVAQVLAIAESAPGALATGVSGHRTVLSVATRAPTESDAQMHLVTQIRGLEIRGVDRAMVGGASAKNLDLRDAISRRLPAALAFIVVVTFVLLFLAFGSLVMPLKAIVMNVLSLSAGFGALVLIFQDGTLEGVLGYQSTGTVDVTVPVTMFAVLFGLAMDYELFLLSRIREEYDRVQDNAASIAFGIEQSGTIITRAALLLVAVMLGFVTADMLLIKELGVGMIIAIVVDVTIVRGLLVPATMKLLGHYNWWAPGPLSRLWARFGLGREEAHA